jgi:5-methylcytosine-specific restriction endonuclease McrA
MTGKPGWRKGTGAPPVTITCVHCGAAFLVPIKRTNQAPNGVRFCSTSCWYAHRRENPAIYPGWRGGVEPYFGPNWNEQARKARARDKYTCQDCGVRQERPRLDVHHLVPRRSFAGDYRAANDLSNLVSLCKSCHKKREVAMTAARIV